MWKMELQLCGRQLGQVVVQHIQQGGGRSLCPVSRLSAVVAYVKGIMAKSKNIAFDSAIC